jgi:light-regulated signal transduction histidine kinase (bacteriophytochrome)
MEKTPYLKEVGDKRQMQSGNKNALDKDFTEFMDLAVHDLDAPLRKLTVLIGMLTTKVTADQDIPSYIERIENCVGDMRSLIDDLSAFGKLNSDELKFVPCAIDEVIQLALQEIPAAIKEKKAVITTVSLPTLEADLRQLIRLFEKLIENAIKFSGTGTGPEIQIQSSVLTAGEKDRWNLDGGRLYYKIEINDNGIGFNNEYADKIFKPFIRLHGKSQFPGNGIGLAICKKIVDNHDGIIYAEGRENEGAKFILILPESH